MTMRASAISTGAAGHTISAAAMPAMTYAAAAHYMVTIMPVPVPTYMPAVIDVSHSQRSWTEPRLLPYFAQFFVVCAGFRAFPNPWSTSPYMALPEPGHKTLYPTGFESRSPHSQNPFCTFLLDSFIRSFLPSIHPSIHYPLPPLSRSFIHSFVRSFVHSLIHSLTHSFIQKFTHSFIHSLIHSFIHSFTHSCIHAFMHSCIHAFMHSFIHSCMHSFIHWFIGSVRLLSTESGN